jgi:hypothetical protein
MFIGQSKCPIDELVPIVVIAARTEVIVVRYFQIVARNGVVYPLFGPMIEGELV